MSSLYKAKFNEDIRNYLSDDEWLYAEMEYKPLDNLENESRFTLTSGKMSSRGSHEEGFSRKTLPAHYIHGVFDRSEAYQRELVNTPDWAKLKMYVELEPISLETSREISEYIRVLDMKNGLIAKHYIHESLNGRKTRVETVKFLSRKDQNVGGLRYYITPLNYEGVIELENIIDASVTNFMDYPRFRVKHLEIRDIYSLNGNGIGVLSETRDYLQAICTTSAVTVSNLAGERIETEKKFKPYGEVACEFFDVKARVNKTMVIDKFATIAIERDGFDVRKIAERDLKNALMKGVEYYLNKNKKIYDNMWSRADIGITGDEKMQKALRFNIFHLMSTPNPYDSSTNLGAKLMHGEEYGGHAFWDTELFMLPFFSLVFPEIAKQLVEYRYRMLPGAKRNARKYNYLGARYPWESADTGDEECPQWTVLYDGTVEPCTVADDEIHVTADIIYGGIQYYLFTGDKDYLYNQLIEMLVETSRYWLSRLEWNSGQQVYELTGVTGPDEWHERVSNNTFTNYIVCWSLSIAADIVENIHIKEPEIYSSLVKKVALNNDETEKWKEISKLIYLPESDSRGIIEQFQGYFNLQDCEISEYNNKNMPIFPKELSQYDREQTSIIKQADIVMLMFLFRDKFAIDVQQRNFDFYEKRTMHGSSLSPSIHCLMGVYTGNDDLAYEYLERTAYIDLEDRNKNTREGLHAAAMGGTWQAVVFGFGGLTIHTNGEIHFEPKLPNNWTELKFNLIYRGNKLSVIIKHDNVEVYSDKSIDLEYFYKNKAKKVKVK